MTLCTLIYSVTRTDLYLQEMSTKAFEAYRIAKNAFWKICVLHWHIGLDS
jgi:hypothetical protein